MLKILMSLLTIVLVSASAIGATRAYFTDSETSSGNTFSAGTLNVVIDGDGSSTSAYFDVDNMAPGDSDSACVQVRNAGNLDMLFRVYVDGDTQSPSTFADQLNVNVVMNDPSCPTPGGYGTYGPNVTIYNNSLSGLIGEGNALNNVSAAFDDHWPLPGSYAATYKVTVTMPTSVGNDYQNATFSGDLKVDATQFDNQEKSSIQW